jgi:hypothetical protein
MGRYMQGWSSRQKGGFAKRKFRYRLSDPQVNIDRPQGAGSPIPTHRLLFKPKEPALRHPVGSA